MEVDHILAEDAHNLVEGMVVENMTAVEVPHSHCVVERRSYFGLGRKTSCSSIGDGIGWRRMFFELFWRNIFRRQRLKEDNLVSADCSRLRGFASTLTPQPAPCRVLLAEYSALLKITGFCGRSEVLRKDRRY